MNPLTLLLPLIYAVVFGSLLIYVIEQLYSKFSLKHRNPVLLFILSFFTSIPILIVLSPSFTYLGIYLYYTPIVILGFIILKFLLKRVKLNLLIAVVILLALFYPKYSTSFDMYSQNGENLRCGCLGFQSKTFGIDSYGYNCYGIPYSCKMVKYNPAENN